MEKKLTEVFDTDQAKVIVNLTDELNSLKAKLGDAELVDTKGKNDVVQKDSKVLKKAVQLWKDNGVIPGLARGKRVLYKDLCEIDSKHSKEMRDSFSNDHPLLIPRVISEVVKEAIEPNIVLTPMLQTIAYQHGSQLTFPSVGAITASDIPEGGEYPERSLEFAGQVVATIGKSGVAVKFSEEMIRYSLYDVMSMHLRAAGKALIRWKEYKVAKLILDTAGSTNTLFDNTANSTTYLHTTGRNANGGYNGCITLDDFFKAYALMVTRGFIPDTLIMNPFAWTIFADEALQRVFGFHNGGAMWSHMQGMPGNAPQWRSSGMNGLLQNTQVTAPQQLATTYTNMPSMFPYPFRIVVSPYMPYDATQNVTDMILCNSNEMGVLVVDETVQTETWNDPAHDIMKTKLRERYGMAAINNGQGMGIIKGVYLGKNFDYGHNVQTNIDLTGLTNSFTGDYGGNQSALFNATY